VTYVDYAAEAKSHRKMAAHCYYDSRKSARQAANAYEDARQFRRTAEFYAHFRAGGPDNYAAKYESLAYSTVSLADTYLNSSFNSMDHARFYSDLARKYDALQARRDERLSV